MTTFLDLLAKGEVKMEKCGDVVVSPQDNMIGLFCHFCCDIFTNLTEFMNHLQWMHNNMIAFTKEHNVYTVEELMALEDPPSQQDADDISQANSSRSSDSGVAVGDATPAQQQLDCLSYNIINSLSAYDVEFDKSIVKSVENWQTTVNDELPEKPKRNVLAEVEAMLFDEETNIQQETAVDHSTELQQILQSAGVQVTSQESQVEPEQPKRTSESIVAQPILTEEPSRCHNNNVNCTGKEIEDLNAPGQSRMRTTAKGNLGKAHTICDLKSYTIARSARKREQQQRLGHIKKRIFRSLKSKPVKPMRLPFSEIKMEQIMKQFNLIPKQNFTTKKLTENQAELKLNANQEILQPTVKVNNLKTSPNPSSNFEIMSAQKDKVNALTKPKIIKNMLSTEEKCKPKNISSVKIATNAILIERVKEPTKSVEKNEINRQTVKKPIEITKIENLPNINFVKPNQSAAGAAKKPVERPTLTGFINQLTNVKEPYTKRKSTTSITADSTIKSTDGKRAKTETNTSLSFDLSESVVEFLQSDLKTSQLDADSLLELAEPNEQRNSDPFDSIIKQVAVEQKSKDVPKQEASKTKETQEYNENVAANQMRPDETLLPLVGLSILVDDSFEEKATIESSDAMRLKASKFSKMLKLHDMVWNPKKVNAQGTHKIWKEFNMLTTIANAEFKASFTIAETKRIVNLINSWHAQQIELKFFKKMPLSTGTEHYLRLFGFFPKINRSLYYCEWCDKTAVNNLRYEKHRLIHMKPNISCPHCERYFKKRGYFINHLRAIHGEEFNVMVHNVP
ncbi:tef [Drosophila busckii]|uniref:Tef n=1 Tax=Drosophila busckii TaxID=30019 RepID=A0A0M4ECL0_DROBS|nr:protein teflon [Drosophila busckii]ALC40526.1 tef [Drosophila busckii]